MRRRRFVALTVVAALVGAAALGVSLPWSALAERVMTHVREPEPTDWPYRETIVIRSGDTLWQIARSRYPGEDPRRMVHEIRAMNGWIDPGALQPGDELVVPAPPPALAGADVSW